MTERVRPMRRWISTERVGFGWSQFSLWGGGGEHGVFGGEPAACVGAFGFEPVVGGGLFDHGGAEDLVLPKEMRTEPPACLVMALDFEWAELCGGAVVVAGVWQ